MKYKKKPVKCPSIFPIHIRSIFSVDFSFFLEIFLYPTEKHIKKREIELKTSNSNDFQVWSMKLFLLQFTTGELGGEL